MNTKAKLRLLFDKYGVSSRAAKNFINYFLNHAELAVSCSVNGYDRTDHFDSASSHENGVYSFVINNIGGMVPYDEHEPTEEFNFNLRVVCAESEQDYGNDFHVKIRKDAVLDKMIVDFYYMESLLYTYTADKDTWTAEKISAIFPNGLPDGVDPLDIKDFDPLLVNEDYFDDGETKIKEFLYFECSGGFNKSAITTTEEELDMHLHDGVLKAGSNVCTVSGTMSSESGDSITLDKEILKLEKVDDNTYVLNIKSEKEFDTFNIDVNIAPEYTRLYAAVQQKYFSHVAGYNFQIPLQPLGDYTKLTDKLWYAAGDKDFSVGINFCNLLIGNKEDDEVKIEFTKVDARAVATYNGNGSNLTFYSVEPFEYGNDYRVNLYRASNVNGNTKVEIYYGEEKIFSALKTATADESGNVRITQSDFEALVDSEDSTKLFTQFITPAGHVVVTSRQTQARSLSLPLADGDKPRAEIRIYLNDVLFAKSYSKQFNRVYEDSYWPATLKLTLFNGTDGTNNNTSIRMIQYNSEGEIIDRNAAFGNFMKMYNYDGEIAYFMLDLRETESTTLTMQSISSYLATHPSQSTLAVELLPHSKLKSSLLAFKTRYEIDRHRSLFDEFNSSSPNLNIPVTAKIIQASERPLSEDSYPYKDMRYSLSSPFIEYEIERAKEAIQYDLKTPVFTISYPLGGGEYELTNAYYKIGICALDCSSKSTEELIKSFISKTCFTVQYDNLYRLEVQPYSGTSYRRYSFAVKPRSGHEDDDTFYSVAGMLTYHDKSSPIFNSWNDDITDPSTSTTYAYNLCSTALVPIIEMPADRSPGILRGVMFIDMFNADDNTIIDRQWGKSTDMTISISGEDAMHKEILLSRIR